MLGHLPKTTQVDRIFILIISVLSLIIISVTLVSVACRFYYYRKKWQTGGNSPSKQADKYLITDSSDEDIIFYANNKYVDDTKVSKCPPACHLDFVLQDEIGVDAQVGDGLKKPTEEW